LTKSQQLDRIREILGRNALAVKKARKKELDFYLSFPFICADNLAGCVVATG
jgi:hypothetical protein